MFDTVEKHSTIEGLACGALAGRLPVLDSIRGFAVMSVVLYHASPRTFPGGWFGVDIFFVLSGYLITSLLSLEIWRTGRLDFGAFYRRRFARLFPAFFVFSLCFAAASLVFFDGTERSERLSKLLQVVTFRANFMDQAQAFGLGAMWSLSLEEQFYLVWPFTLFFLTVAFAYRNRSAVLTFAVVGVWVWRFALWEQGASGERLYYRPDMRVDMLLMGALVAWMPLRVRVRKPIAIAAVLVSVGMMLFAQQYRWVLGAGPLALGGLSLAVTFFTLVQRTVAGRKVPTTRVLRYFGRISYSLYLWHLLVLGLVEDHLPGPKAFRVWAGVLASVGIADLSFRFVERPGQRILSDTQRHEVRAVST